MYEVHTDGSCLGNPGRGGWGAISTDFKLCGAQPNTTNNVMEMTAIIKALEQCLWMGKLHVCIITDSNYVKNGITSWIHNWKKNGWKTASQIYLKDVLKCQQIIDAIVPSSSIKLFRFPYGRLCRTQMEILKKKYKIISCEKISEDYQTNFDFLKVLRLIY